MKPTNRKPSLRNVAQRLMDEHIHLPGCPQLVVTRGHAYHWLKECGYDENERGFGSIDYAVFSPKAVSEPLSNLDEYRGFLAYVKADMRA